MYMHEERSPFVGSACAFGHTRIDSNYSRAVEWKPSFLRGEGESLIFRLITALFGHRNYHE